MKPVGKKVNCIVKYKVGVNEAINCEIWNILILINDLESINRDYFHPVSSLH